MDSTDSQTRKSKTNNGKDNITSNQHNEIHPTSNHGSHAHYDIFSPSPTVSQRFSYPSQNLHGPW
jgi:hypothetical protein